MAYNYMHKKAPQLRTLTKVDDERVCMIVHAMDMAITDLLLSVHPMTRENVIEKLDQYRRETGNVSGKGVERNASEIVRIGRKIGA